ncbi:hypothetical protein [Comamonas sp. wu1-DMT]|uniref:hypothetical protein n=1 Tax=Comamonas sp. wu1-DMT TaxID=3126390 RepID=UPI0032E41251
MSKKIHLNLEVTSSDGSRNFQFRGAASRDLIEILYWPEFCVVTKDDLTSTKVLIARDSLQMGTDKQDLAVTLPRTSQIYSPKSLIGPPLYIHKSVKQCFVEKWREISSANNHLMRDYGFGLPASKLEFFKSVLTAFAFCESANFGSPLIGHIEISSSEQSAYR